MGFGLSLAIVFVYYVVMTICSFAAEALVALAALVGVGSEHYLYRDRLEPIAASGAGMNFVEIVRGIGNLAVVMAIAGAVAYVGDRVGHQVGRRRLSLFGIRPRYTSTIVAIATGVIIALVVSLTAIFASQEVKTAFFKLNSINQQIGELQARQRDLEAKVNNGRLVYRSIR